MTFSLRSLALAILAIAALAGGAVALTNPKSDSTVLGSEWQHKTAFVITTCALRTQRQAVPALETVEADRYIFAPIR